MNFLQLQYFETVAAYQSISKAAQELHVTQPALSNMLAKLEDELGASLFDRVGKKLVLNQRGEAFLHSVSQSLLILNQAAQRVRDGSDQECIIRIGLKIESARLLALVEDFLALYPQTQIHYVDIGKVKGASPTLSCDFLLHAGYLDYGLPHMLLDQRREIVAVLPAGHPLAGRESIRLEELRGESFVFASPDKKRLSYSHQICLDEGFTPQVRYVTDGLVPRDALVALGGCVSLTYNTDWNIRKVGGPLAYVPVVLKSPLCRSIYLSWNDVQMTEPAKAFLAFLKARLAQPAGEGAL